MAEQPTCRESITGGILAGGMARRMGGNDKGLIPLNERTMIEYAIAALRPQVKTLIVNANRNLDRYRSFGQPVVEDRLGDFSGPLAGMASLLAAADTPYLLTSPCDSPLLPDDLADRLCQALQRENAEIAVAHDGERMQPVFALVQRRLLPDLEQFLADGGRKIDAWYARHHCINVDFSDNPAAFHNVNTPEEREELEQRLAGTRGTTA